MTVSSAVTRTSAAVLLLGGLALLFAADAAVPAFASALVRAVPPGAPSAPGAAAPAGDVPAAARFLGQALGAAWLGVAALNGLSRDAVVGGVYGRPVVLANLTLYVVTALSALRALPAAGPRARALAAPAAVLAAAYGLLLTRGPFGPRPVGGPGAARGGRARA